MDLRKPHPHSLSPRERRRDYLIGSAAGMLPAIALKAYVGAAGMGAVSEGGPFKWALFVAGVAATLAVAWIVRRKAILRGWTRP